MKLDGLAVILAIILMPIILVVTYFIQLQVDTIATENSYNTKLLDATYDAMSAFEINTANEELSSVADSMRSIILASNNVFLNTLATNLGMSNASKEYLQPYISAVLYTMYDGYYIYSPTETPVVAEKKEIDSDGLVTTKGYLALGDEGTEGLSGVVGDVVYEKENGTYTTNKNEAKMETDYVLKSYVQYSARYVKSNIDVTINYTLDNYLNVEGKIGDIYYTKTGYLIDKNLVTLAASTGNVLQNCKNENDAKNLILGYKTNTAETTISPIDYIIIKVNGVQLSSTFSTINTSYLYKYGMNVSTISEAKTDLKLLYDRYNNGDTGVDLKDLQDIEYQIQLREAIAYYASAKLFSDWVYSNLGDLTYDNIQDLAMTGYYSGVDENGNLIYSSTSKTGKDDLYYDFHGTLKTSKIFDENENPEDTESKFNTHKMEVIKNSIKYNLNLAMSSYNKMDKKLKDYQASMPVLLDEEWDKILSNISIVSFMQGWDCGLDIYNNYQIVSSTNNELTVTPTEIYYVKKNEFNNAGGSYHRIDCPELADTTEYISFKSKEVKYDKVQNSTDSTKYLYDHRNLACYTCINNNNYGSNFAKEDYTSFYNVIKGLSDNKKKAAYIAVGCQRQRIYKTNALPVSEGYKIFSNNLNLSSGGMLAFSQDLNKVTKLKITFANTISSVPVLNFTVHFGGISDTKNISLNANQKTPQTVTIDVSNLYGNITSLIFENSDANTSYEVENIKVIYK